MKIKKVLVLYKRSVYKNYFLDKASTIRNRLKTLPREHRLRLEKVHLQHYETLKIVEENLKINGILYNKSIRGKRIDYTKFDLVITVGGDGTFLEAARNIKNQLIFGVNSSPQWSVGNFCSATAANFPAALKRILADRFRIQLLHRLVVKGSKSLNGVNILNDVLIAHVNPAATSRYDIQIGPRREEQRSSGVWVSTAAGSTGAISAAGGKKLPITSGNFQYLCRELYSMMNKKYHFRAGVLTPSQTIKVTSFMREGMIFLDGSRLSAPFPFGEEVTIAHSPFKLRTIRF